MEEGGGGGNTVTDQLPIGMTHAKLDFRSPSIIKEVVRQTKHLHNKPLILSEVLRRAKKKKTIILIKLCQSRSEGLLLSLADLTTVTQSEHAAV